MAWINLIDLLSFSETDDQAWLARRAAPAAQCADLARRDEQSVEREKVLCSAGIEDAVPAGRRLRMDESGLTA